MAVGALLVVVATLLEAVAAALMVSVARLTMHTLKKDPAVDPGVFESRLSECEALIGVTRVVTYPLWCRKVAAVSEAFVYSSVSSCSER